MRKFPGILFVLLFFTIISGVCPLLAHMGESHKEGQKVQKHDTHSMRGKMPMKKLHMSMSELNKRVDMIFHSIIYSNFKNLGESAGSIRKVAKGLKDTFPHKRLSKLDEYRALAGRLLELSTDFEEKVKKGDPKAITASFGEMIRVCVECHIKFRDPGDAGIPNGGPNGGGKKSR